MEHRIVDLGSKVMLSRILKYIDKAPEENLLKILNVAERHFKMYPKENFRKMKAAVNDKDNVYMQLAKGILKDVDKAAKKEEQDKKAEEPKLFLLVFCLKKQVFVFVRFFVRGCSFLFDFFEIITTGKPVLCSTSIRGYDRLSP